MVSRKALLIAATAMAIVVGALLPATATAWPDNHVVGDDKGWKLAADVNYFDWANSVKVKAGDTLEFVYFRDRHNVVKVNEDDYNNCDATNGLETWNTGNDYVQLPDPGTYYFICGIGNHCDLGPMKFSITAF